jgi:hypothetical protein
MPTPVRKSSPVGVSATLAERGKRYGDFSVHAEIAQNMQASLHAGCTAAGKDWYELSAVQRQALTVICDKMARVISGDPNYADNWHDIQGYAKLAEDSLHQTPGK